MAWAQQINYIDADGNPATRASYYSLDASVTGATGELSIGMDNQETWFVLSGSNLELHSKLTCHGNIHLILCDGASLTIQSEFGGPLPSEAIMSSTSNDNTLTIYGQANQTGQIVAKSSDLCLDFGGEAITINGGNLTMTGSHGIDCGSLVINRGTVNATGTYKGILRHHHHFGQHLA